MSLYGSPLLTAFSRSAPQASPALSDAATAPNISIASKDNSASGPASTALPIGQTKRKVQNVLTNTNKARVAKWMIQTAEAKGKKHIISLTVKHFPHLFREPPKANLQRASRYWKLRYVLTASEDQVSKRSNRSFVRKTKNALQRHYPKAGKGRGRKMTLWVAALHKHLLEEFNRMRKARIKFNARILRKLSMYLISGKTNGEYHQNMTDLKSGKPIKDCITPQWIQSFMEKSNIGNPAQCGKLMVSPTKQEKIEREVAFYIGQLAREFRSNLLKERDVFNADETHFRINMDNHKTLDLVGEKNFRYADVASSDDGMILMVLISGGPTARLETPMLIFKNMDKNYPIRGLPDNVPRVVYRTAPKEWMDKRVFLQWVQEKRVFQPLQNGRKRVLYMDNVNTHDVTEGVKATLQESNTEIRFFPFNATHLVQPADSFIIQKLKSFWQNEWDDYKMEALDDGLCSNGRRSSGKLTNPGKRHFLKLATKSVRAVSAQRDSDGVAYVRKAMVRCGMALNLNGKWEKRQLFPQLQAIIRKYRSHFEGEVVGEIA